MTTEGTETGNVGSSSTQKIAAGPALEQASHSRAHTGGKSTFELKKRKRVSDTGP